LGLPPRVPTFRACSESGFMRDLLAFVGHAESAYALDRACREGVPVSATLDYLAADRVLVACHTQIIASPLSRRWPARKANCPKFGQHSAFLCPNTTIRGGFSRRPREATGPAPQEIQRTLALSHFCCSAYKTGALPTELLRRDTASLRALIAPPSAVRARPSGLGTRWYQFVALDERRQPLRLAVPAVHLPSVDRQREVRRRLAI